MIQTVVISYIPLSGETLQLDIRLSKYSQAVAIRWSDGQTIVFHVYRIPSVKRHYDSTTYTRLLNESMSSIALVIGCI
jgi:hypothetical protein